MADSAEDRKDAVKGWNSRIDRAETTRSDWIPQWEKNYRAVYGIDWMKDGKRDEDSADGTRDKKGYDYDLILAFLKTELPSLVLHRPEVFLNARTEGEETNPQAQKEAKRIESRVNTILADMDGLPIEIRCMLVDAHCAYGIAKILPVLDIVPHPQAGKPKLDGMGNPYFDPDSETNDAVMYPKEIIKESGYDI